MVGVVRLQGLSVAASSEDIRRFFTGYKIPDGGVHIIGGDLEEAFIIFASEKDGARAMTRSGGCIKGAPVILLESSNAEMQNLLEKSMKDEEEQERRSQNLKRRPEESARRGRRSGDPEFGGGRGSRGRSGGHSPPPSQRGNDFLYVRLQGMPFSVTEKEVRDFFRGTRVDGVILLKRKNGENDGRGLVKFATRDDAKEGLKRHGKYIGSRYVEIASTTESFWNRSTTGYVLDHPNMGMGGGGNFRRDRSPIRSQNYPQPRARSPEQYIRPPQQYDRQPHQQYERSPQQHIRSPQQQQRVISPQRHVISPQRRVRSPSPVVQRSAATSDEEYCVLLENLAYTVEKEDLKRLFPNAKLENDQILHLIDSEGRRTRSSFVLFKSVRDYCDALTRERELLNRAVHSRPISREKMIALLESESRGIKPTQDRSQQERSPAPRGETTTFSILESDKPSRSSDQQAYDSSKKMCLYVRNLPFDVRKVELLDLFVGFNIAEDRVYLLGDHQGVGIGKALILLPSESEAMRAYRLNGTRFLGSELAMECISLSEMRQMGVEPPMMSQQEMPPLPRDGQYSRRSSEPSYHNPSRESEYANPRSPSDHYMLPMAMDQQPHSQRGGPDNNEPYIGGGCFSQQDNRSDRDNIDYPDFRGPRDYNMQGGNSQQPHMEPHMDRGYDNEPSFQGGGFSQQDRDNRDMDYPDFRGPRDCDPYAMGNNNNNYPQQQDGRFDDPMQDFERPTGVQLLNLPFKYKVEEIYDFCYGYRVVPGSISLQLDRNGRPKGFQTVLFESHQEAMRAIEELNGRPLGQRNIQLRLM